MQTANTFRDKYPPQAPLSNETCSCLVTYIA